MTKRPKAAVLPKKINLGLQGGGAHGAFTWGVLDCLLEDERIDIEGISGTPAGALNAVMLADGLARGGAAEARKRLDDFWRAARRDGLVTMIERAPLPICRRWPIRGAAPSDARVGKKPRAGLATGP